MAPADDVARTPGERHILQFIRKYLGEEDAWNRLLLAPSTTRIYVRVPADQWVGTVPGFAPAPEAPAPPEPSPRYAVPAAVKRAARNLGAAIDQAVAHEERMKAVGESDTGLEIADGLADAMEAHEELLLTRLGAACFGLGAVVVEGRLYCPLGASMDRDLPRILERVSVVPLDEIAGLDAQALAEA